MQELFAGNMSGMAPQGLTEEEHETELCLFACLVFLAARSGLHHASGTMCIGIDMLTNSEYKNCSPEQKLGV